MITCNYLLIKDDVIFIKFYINTRFSNIEFKNIISNEYMCGIWAIINRVKLTSEKLAGFDKVKPRGPDHSIIHLNDSSIIGFHRLAINDLSSKGEQPFCVFN